MKIPRFLIVVMILLAVSGNGAVATTEFSDIAGNPYEANIKHLAETDVVHGYDDYTFRPTQAINRAELLKIVFEAIDVEAGDYPGGCFSDVKDEWFAPYVCRAKDLGIIKGYDDGYYRPEREANMVETLKIIIKAFELPVRDSSENENWYLPYMDFAHNNNLFSKYSYWPGRSSNRGEVAFLVDRMVDIERMESFIDAERITSSPGCGKNPPSSPPEKFTVNGVERSAITVIPSGYSSDKEFSVIFAFHGRTNSNAMVRTYYGIEKASNGEAIVVYPAGIQAASGYTWSDGGDSAGELRDYEFFDVMLKEISENYCVNMDEIYAVGHSLGGWFTNSLACARGDVLRGVASLGGARSNSTCTGPVAVMQWHNPNDELASFSSGEAARDNFLAQNVCTEETVTVEPAWGNCVEYQGCSDFSPVVWCPHNVDYDSRGRYYTHTWPKSTGEEMWKFLDGLE